jgi:plastocyanin
MKTIYRSHRTSASILILMGSLLLFAAGCSKTMNDQNGTGNNPPSNEVFMQGGLFSPATITVALGTTVKWTNKDGVTHNVTSDDGVFTSPNIINNGTFTYTFSVAGTFPYHCTIHPSMTATIIVD